MPVVIGRGTGGAVYWNITTPIEPGEVETALVAFEEIEAANPGSPKLEKVTEERPRHHDPALNNTFAVVTAVNRFDSAPTMTELKDVMKGGDNQGKHRWILEAEENGFLVREKGRGRTMHVSLTGKGYALLDGEI